MNSFETQTSAAASKLLELDEPVIGPVSGEQFWDQNSVLEAIARSPILDSIDSAERQEAISETAELYAKTREVIAPIITGFADTLLTESNPDEQLLFAARDGLGAYTAAQVLTERFPDRYPAKPENISYAYLTRAIVQSSQPKDVARYLESIGVDTLKPTKLVDIGMYGTMMYDLNRIFPNIQARYLISKNGSIPGYIDGPDNPGRVASVAQVIGNPAIHFLEDTFSGVTGSPKQLIEVDGVPQPLFERGLDAYPGRELLKRTYAMQAIKDYAGAIEQPDSIGKLDANIAKLDDFLGQPDLYKHLMVPHIRG